MSSENSFNYLPYFTEGKVVRGFGRGGAELGIPTANFPDNVIAQLPDEFVCGVYYGWACVNTLSSDVHKMVMCCGWNTHFQNTIKTMETHIMHKFDNDFYGESLRIIILGYIRPMEAYDSLDALITAVNKDIQMSEESLSLPSMMEFSHHSFLTRGLTPLTTNTTGGSHADSRDASNDHRVVSPPSTLPTSAPIDDKTDELLNKDSSRQHDDGIVNSCETSSPLITEHENNRSSVAELSCCYSRDSLSSGYCDSDSVCCQNEDSNSCDRNDCRCDGEGKGGGDDKTIASTIMEDDNKQTIKCGDSQQHSNGINGVLVKNELNKL